MSAQHAALFDGLPDPVEGALTVYVFGPGFGESQVVALPGGKWMVVDSCEQNGVNLPLALLQHFGVQVIDLLVMTHPDLDHYRGIPDIIAAFEIKRFWRYPGFATWRDLLVDLERTGRNARFGEMCRVMDAILSLTKTVRAHEVCYGNKTWPRDASFGVTCIAPCSSEKTYESERRTSLVRRFREGEALTASEVRRLMGEANSLSLALVIWWGKVGVLLGGDVEHDAANDARGWRGVIGNLREDGELHLIQGLRLVKAAHHGSEGAFSEDAWTHHATPDPVELAVVTRFNRGRNPPPQASGLEPIGRFARRIALTSKPSGGWSRILGRGFVRVDHPGGPGAAACVAITLTEMAPADIRLSAQSALFAPTASLHPGAMAAT